MMFSVLCLVEQTSGGGHKQSNLMQNYSELLQEHNCDSCVVLISKYLCDSSHFPSPFSFPAPLHLMPTIHNALSNLSPFFFSLSLLSSVLTQPWVPYATLGKKKFKHLFLIFFFLQKKNHLLSPTSTFASFSILHHDKKIQKPSEWATLAWFLTIPLQHVVFLFIIHSSAQQKSPFCTLILHSFPMCLASVTGVLAYISSLLSLPPLSLSLHSCADVSRRVGGKRGFN